jgi:AraC-like DNA-binding protein
MARNTADLREPGGMATRTNRFTDAYGKTPLAYLTMLRVEEMARLLRETGLTVEQAGRQIGWSSRNRATDAFKQATGLTPSRYRALRMTENRHPA